MKKFFITATIVVASMLAFLVNGCGGSSANSAIFDLRVVDSDGVEAKWIGPAPDLNSTYEVFVGKTTKINFVWAPNAPADVTYSVVTSLDQSKTRTVSEVVDGFTTVLVNQAGTTTVSVTAFVGGKELETKTIHLQAK